MPKSITVEIAFLLCKGASPNYFGKDDVILTFGGGGGGGAGVSGLSNVLNKKKWRPNSHNLRYQ